MQIKRPIINGSHRLFYRPVPKISKRMVNYRDPVNMVIQIRLYRWSASDTTFTHEVEKNRFIKNLFSDINQINVHRVGRIITDAVQYKPHCLKNPGEKNGPVATHWWRFNHRLDLHYGIERMVTSWLPALQALEGDFPTNEKELILELEDLIEQTEDEDEELIITPSIAKMFEVTTTHEDEYLPPKGRRKIMKLGQEIWIEG